MTSIESLAEQLGSADGLERHRARLRLVDQGAAAVSSLVEALDSPNEHKRWEAAKALSEIPDERATEALVRALEDRAFGVRWLAANALVSIGSPVLVPILRALIDRPDSTRLRERAGHVLRSIGTRDESFKPVAAGVLDALESVEPVNSVPWAARDVLRGLGLLPQ